MEVILAKTAGFCFGVKRAVDTVYEEIGRANGPIYTYGPIIHNENVVKDLEEKGVSVIPEDAQSFPKSGTAVIRSHGVSREAAEHLKEVGLSVVDATCPFVKKIHRIVEEEGKNGRVVLIAGDPTHPEVQGIMGWASGRVETITDADAIDGFGLSKNEPVTIVAQTTFNYKKFLELVAKIEEKGYDIKCLNTICNATQERQEEAMQVARSVDVMFVVGGKHSSNTQKLYEICKKECNRTYHIQSVADIREDILFSGDVVGITAGASTPNNIIEEVQTYVRSKF